MDTAYREIAHRLRHAERVLFVTGAGISVDSGLPTYRGPGGLYETRSTGDGYAIEEALSGAMLRTRPEVTWKYLLEIEHRCRGALPNLAHRIIAQLEDELPEVVVLTQNVDGLHLAAGSRRVIELHGNLHTLACTHCAYRTQVADYHNLTVPPRCPCCRETLRPDVVLFGETLPTAALTELAAVLDRGLDLVCSIGTSSLFPYVAAPVIEAAAAGIPTVEINPETTALSDRVSLALRAGASDAMVGIWQALYPGRALPGSGGGRSRRPTL